MVVRGLAHQTVRCAAAVTLLQLLLTDWQPQLLTASQRTYEPLVCINEHHIERRLTTTVQQLSKAVCCCTQQNI